MPKILEDRIKAIKRKGKVSDNSAWAIATSALQKEGKLPKKHKAEDGKIKVKG